MGAFYVATSSGLAAYDTTLLSVHMVQHMVLSMLVPLALALGAPVTLALRTLPQRPRAAAAPGAALAAGPRADLPAADLPAVRAQPVGALLQLLVRRVAALGYVHEMMHVHLVLVGSLFLWPLVGVDPVPGRVGYPFRMLLMVLTLPFHAFLGLTIMSQDKLIARAGTTVCRWRGCPSPAEDQHLAGGILWGTGDLVGLTSSSCSSRSGRARRCGRPRARTGGSTCSRAGRPLRGRRRCRRSASRRRPCGPGSPRRRGSGATPPRPGAAGGAPR